MTADDCALAGDGEHDCTDPTAEASCRPVELPAYIVAARAEAAAKYPAHVLAEGGPDHYAAGLSQELHQAILCADWNTVRRIAADPYAAGDDVDMARGALAGAGEEL